MYTFLDRLLDQFEDPHTLQDYLFIFPNRRMRHFFRRTVGQRIQRPILLPETQSIDDFFQQLSPLQIAERLDLLLPLYRIFNQSLQLPEEKQESFEAFMPWGEMMLRDFDEVDKHLINADRLFQNLAELEQIEQVVGLDEEQKKAIRRFWSAFSDQELPQFERNFLNVWAALRKTYPVFRQWQERHQMAGEGLAQRVVIEQLDDLLMPVLRKKKAVIFAGFNALTGTEMALVKDILQKEKGRIYWDGDQYYLNDDHQEAGHYMRKHQETLRLLQQTHPFADNVLSDNEHQVTAVGVQGSIGQVKAAGDWLRQRVDPSALREGEHPATSPQQDDIKKTAPEDMAIVLAEESLLIPLLQSLPVRTVNVTMGVTLERTPLFSAFEAYAYALETRNAEGHFRLKDLLQALEHPILKRTLTFSGGPSPKKPISAALVAATLRAQPRFRVSPEAHSPTGDEKLASPEAMTAFFGRYFPPLQSQNGRALLQSTLVWIERLLEGDPADALERESQHHLGALLRQTLNWIDTHQLQFSLASVRRILRERARNLRMPFEGEPLEGVQIMGLLETQGIDFKHVMVLSTNEGVLPPRHNVHSFIPYNLRRGYGLPAQEETEATSAHHFFRLLQRCETATLFYNSQTGGTNKGEPSRYVRQIEMEMCRKLPQMHFHYRIAEFDTHLQPPKPIAIEKHHELVQREFNRRKWLSTDDQISKESQLAVASNGQKTLPFFSASGLHTFLQCPLQWYFRYVEKIKKEEEPEDKDLVAANKMGDVIHKSLEELYKPFLGKGPVSPEALRGLKAQIKETVDALIKSELMREPTQLHGEGFLMHQAALESIRRAIEKDIADAQHAPLEILGLEMAFEKVRFPVSDAPEAPYVLLGGYIDRVDRYDGQLRIIDYKTGGNPKLKFGKRSKEGDSETKLAEECRSSKETFQLRFYDLMFQLNPPEPGLKPAVAAVWPLQKKQELVMKAGMLDPEERNAFHGYLQQQLQKLFEVETPFEQTQDLKACQYCDYQRICRRD